MNENRSSSLRIMHHINLRDGAWGGVERHFAAFLRTAAEGSALRNYVAENLRGASRETVDALACLAEPAADVRRWHGVPVPKSGGLRAALQQARASAWQIDRVLCWNLMGDVGPARIARRVQARAIYWERGAAWFTDAAHVRPGFHEAYDLYLANSTASRAMLQQRWGVRAPIEICSPGVPLSFYRADRAARALPQDRPLRIGFAGRLEAFKGGILAVHAVSELRRRGFDVELWVAGAGPDGDRMEDVAQRSGAASSLKMLGKQSGMADFFDAIDLYLHPALREPYGLVCAEALTAGVPVVVAGVDGLPEVIAAGVDGLCVATSLDLTEFARLGGDPSRVYPLVFDPLTQTIGAPKAAAPAMLADAMACLIADPATYHRFSTGALAAYAERFHFNKHMDRLTALLQEAGEAAG